MQALRIALAAWSLTILVGGCSKGTKSTSETDFWTQFTAAECNMYVRCGLVGASQKSECTTLFGSSWSVMGGVSMPTVVYDREVAAGHLQFDPTAASTCVKAVASEACDGSNFMTVFTTCMAVYAPQVPNGGTCIGMSGTAAFPWECKDGYCGNTTALPSNYTCATGTCLAFKAIGDACDYNFECDKTLAQTTPADDAHVCVNGICGLMPDLNQSCEFDCKSGLFCQTTVGPPGTCVALLGQGAACSDDSNCQAGLCVAIPTRARRHLQQAPATSARIATVHLTVRLSWPGARIRNAWTRSSTRATLADTSAVATIINRAVAASTRLSRAIRPR